MTCSLRILVFFCHAVKANINKYFFVDHIEQSRAFSQNLLMYTSRSLFEYVEYKFDVGRPGFSIEEFGIELGDEMRPITYST